MLYLLVIFLFITLFFYRTFRLFSKKRDVEEFRRVYDINETTNSKNQNKNVISEKNDESLSVVNNSLFKNSSSFNNINGTSNMNNKSIKRKKSKHNTNHEESSCDTNTSSINIACSNTASIGGKNCSSINTTNIANTVVHNSTTFNVITSSISKAVRPCDLRASTVVFGLPLHIILQRTGQPLPQKIIEAMKILRKLAPRAIGIFRKNGVKTRINRLREAIDNNEEFNFHLFYTLYDIADMIKLYFRLLPECLITNKLSDILLANYSSKYLTSNH